MSAPRPVVLCIFDGFGVREAKADNAVTLAKTPNLDRYVKSCPYSVLDASEEHVGLPKGQMGNSEVGHMNLGAGRVVFQDLPMIDRAIQKNELAHNPALQKFIATLKASGGTCHLMGLASPGGVHAHSDHMIALANIISVAGVKVFIHAFLDGRDVPPQSAVQQIAYLENALRHVEGVNLATLCGRYYAMDRDKRWERVEKAYRLLVSADGITTLSATAAIEESYKQNVTDEFVRPIALEGYSGMHDGDGLLMANFRSDRAREILTALLDPAFDGFARNKITRFTATLGMVEYSDKLNPFIPALFPPKDITDTFGEVVARAGKTQLRIAETEKYPHVTFFFNGGREEPYPGEERLLIPSPKVATYDLQPAMAALEVTNTLVEAINSQKFDLVVVNYANGDMVGHTGILPAAIQAVETLDSCLGRLEEAVKKQGGLIFLTADHGNCEMMHDEETRGPHTAHTLNLVPAILINAPATITKLYNGKLADVAPTLLKLMGLAVPPAMDGRCLIQ